MQKVLLASLVCAGLAGVAVAEDRSKSAEPMQPSRAAQALMSSDLKDFFETAASSNLLEIESGKLAAERATDPALKDFGQRMVKDHTKASKDLARLAEQKGVTLPTQMLKRHQTMVDHLRGEERGEEFDDAFREVMITSHKEAVSMFEEVARKGPDEDVRAFAVKMLPKLQQHGSHAKALPEPKDTKS